MQSPANRQVKVCSALHRRALEVNLARSSLRSLFLLRPSPLRVFFIRSRVPRSPRLVAIHLFALRRPALVCLVVRLC
ncbi:hypothetical protein L596_014375 [Steinernema carpocapsae]|uniref:Uncharacterized protein n=1 Tax=Steinernema carpocapsae TaxID=34508 RepID=A0A4U5NBQ9_STECR|nr:hypothetical protein L596_014375 [Steinernema carpocapsae]